ncbi:MAG: glycosyltransferase [Phycisphaerales bacterium]|nr:MAG: glycosyltransferase [Phycisphaerales bacterium]
MSASGSVQVGEHPAIVFAGGGSGGHISPGLAIAERLEEIAPGATALFICSPRAIDAHMLGEAKVEHLAIPAAPFSVRPVGALRFLRGYRASRRRCREVFGGRAISQVVALGGFVAAPVVAEAKVCRLPVTLINLDSPPGKANRLMARKCDRVWSAIELPDHPHFAERVVGMPIRRRALAGGDSAECRRKLGLEEDLPALLVTGASQGATSINRFLAALVESEAGMFHGWQVLHLAGREGGDDVPRACEAAGIRAKIVPFLDEMGLAWGAADLAVSRAGANSVAEAAANCVPTLFLPYPYHRDMHQANNARPLVESGGAVMETDRIDPAENVRMVGPVLQSLMHDDERRLAMRRSLEANRPGDAAAEICRLLLGC